MFRIRKRYLFLTAVVGAIAYMSQYYTLSGWQNLRLIPINQNASDKDSIANSWKSTMATAVANRSVPPSTADGPRFIGWFQDTPGKEAKSGKKTIQLADEPRIRIASFNLHAFNESKLRKSPVVETLARIIRQFDIVALQHISSRQNDILPLLVDSINATDRRYDYCIGPRVGREQMAQQFAFVFDTERIETDREQLYTVEDPQNLMDFEPLVGWFRVKQIDQTKAFTFTLVNTRIDTASANRERALLPDLIRSVKQDGRVEDDVILLGDFSSSSNQLLSITGSSMTQAIDHVATTVSGESMVDNILITTRATDEFTGRSGVIDFLRQLNLTYDQAMQISSHLPVWAEFSAYEGEYVR